MAFGQPGDVGGVIEAAPRIGGIGLGANAATADIGIERLRFGAELRQRLLCRQSGHVNLTLINCIKIDVN